MLTVGPFPLKVSIGESGVGGFGGGGGGEGGRHDIRPSILNNLPNYQVC